MNKEDLIAYKKKLSELTEEESKQRDLYLKGIADGTLQGPPLDIPSVDKPWLKFYGNDKILSDIPHKTIYRYAKEANINNLDLTAINYYGNKISFKTFFEKVDEVANALVGMGMKKGNIATICSPTFPETVILNIALNKIGCIANNIDPRNNASRIQESINNCESEYLFILDIAYPKINSIINTTNVKKTVCISYHDSIPKIKRGIFDMILKKSLKKKGIPISNIDFGDKYINWDMFLKLGTNITSVEVPYEKNSIVSMVMTGGTTGFPKSVQLTNDSAIAMVENYKATDLQLEKGQSLLNFMPEFIAYGWTFGVVMTTCLGIENIIIPQFDVNEFSNYIKKYKPNHLVGVPTHYNHLMSDKKMEKVNLGEFLVSVSAGGDRYDENQEIKFNNFLHEHGFKNNVIVGYGLTENNSSVSTRLNMNNDINSVGIPLMKNNISVFEKGTDLEKGFNEIGELCIDSPSQMSGYYNNPEETNNIIKTHSDGKKWIHTKDMGYIDNDGKIYVLGREKNMIIRPDGHNVWPSEMEKVLLKNIQVIDCCVVGIPEYDGQGEYPRAVIQVNENADINNLEETLKKMCLEELPERDVPQTYSFTTEELPKTGVGKIDRISIRENEINNNKKRR